MTVSVSASSMKKILNDANPNTVSAAMQVMAFGNMVRVLPTYLWRINPNTSTNPYALSTIQSVQLPDDAKAGALLQAFAITGTATAGVMVNDAWGATPSTTLHLAITPSGDLGFLAADAWTAVDVLYVPTKYDVYEVTLPVVSNVLTLPTAAGQVGATGISGIFEVESLAGTLVSKLVILAPGASATTGKAAMNLAKTQVNFASADAVTKARVKFGAVPAIDVNAMLEGTMNSGALANLGLL